MSEVFLELLVDHVLLVEALFEDRRDISDIDLTHNVVSVSLSDVDQHIGTRVSESLLDINPAILDFKVTNRAAKTNTESSVLNDRFDNAVIELIPLVVQIRSNISIVMSTSQASPVDKDCMKMIHIVDRDL